ncbi:site-specific DNA-methyltransferase [Chloroflexi bacterium]|nr:site-specific DNA-methyltransferase [Chloroflexota bacterium]
MKKNKLKTQSSSFGTKGRINHNSSKFYDSNLYKELDKKQKVTKKNGIFPKKLLNKIILGTSENMSVLPDDSLHLMITSPPYNSSKDYDLDMTLEEYLSMLTKVFTETYRVLINGGRACINIANLGRKPYIPLSDYISKIMIEIGFNMRGEIIWNKSAGAGSSTAWGSWMSASNPTLRDVHEYILVFSKGEYKRERKGEEKEIKQNSIKNEDFLEWTKSIWNFNTESAKRIGHPAPFPIELPHRLIQLFSFKTDIILDPFIGSGTTGIAALKSDRKFIGFETNKEYIKIASERISKIIQ